MRYSFPKFVNLEYTRKYQYMIGLILCGGKSTRMGSDKGLQDRSGITWAESSYRKLEPLVSSIAISVNQDQINTYQIHFPTLQLIVDRPELHIGGPLCGLLSSHLAFPEETIFILACDLIYMDPVVLESIAALQNSNPNYGGYICKNNLAVEPLCGIYTAAALQKILLLQQSGSLLKHSMKHVLELIDSFKMEMPENWIPFFKNVNSQHVLNQ